MVMGVFVRPRCFGCPFVHTRCDPQMIMGITGTPASFAMRAAPERKVLSSKLRLMVSSGNTPTSSPAFNASTASRYDSWASPRSTGMCFMARIMGPEILWSKTSFFAMKRMYRLVARAGIPA